MSQRSNQEMHKIFLPNQAVWTMPLLQMTPFELIQEFEQIQPISFKDWIFTHIHQDFHTHTHTQSHRWASKFVVHSVLQAQGLRTFRHNKPLINAVNGPSNLPFL